jgi:outer membrane lipoprotein carrier protein
MTSAYSRFVFNMAAPLLLALACAVSTSANAGALAQLREFIGTAKTASGQFDQSQVRRGGRTESSSGQFSFARPGQFRWEIIKPYEQLVVADGQKTWFYDKDLKQVTIRKTGNAIGATPAALLFGNADFEKEFTVTEMPTRAGMEFLDAIPKNKESTIERVIIGFQNGLPLSIEVRDSFGQTVLVSLKNMQRNAKLDPGQFAFSPPSGVDVIEQ